MSARLLSLPSDTKGITGSNYLDYESAQQLIWSAKLLYDESIAVGGNADPKLDVAIQSFQKKDPDRKVVFFLREPDAKGMTYIRNRLQERMNPISRFDQVSFRKLFGK